MVRENRGGREAKGKMHGLLSTKVFVVHKQSQCCSPKEPLKIQTLSSEIVKLTNKPHYGSRNCCKLHMLSCVESSHTCLIRTYIFRLRSPSNIYFIILLPKTCTHPPLYVLCYTYHLTLAVAVFMFGVSCYLLCVMVSHLNMCSVELLGVCFIIIEQSGIKQHG